MTVRVLHVSDTHLSRNGTSEAHPGLAAGERLTAALGAAREHGPYAVAVVTGDIADDGSTEACGRVRAALAELAPVVLGVPGNHDHTAGVAEVFGPVDVRVGPWRLLGAATNLPLQVHGHAEPVLAALDVLDADPTAYGVVLHHHPLRSRSTHEWFRLDGAELLESRLAGWSRPLVLLSGHTHEAYDDTVGAARLLGAPSTFYAIRHDGPLWEPVEGGTGARVLDLHDDGTVTTEVVLA